MVRAPKGAVPPKDPPKLIVPVAVKSKDWALSTVLKERLPDVALRLELPCSKIGFAKATLPPAKEPEKSTLPPPICVKAPPMIEPAPERVSKEVLVIETAPVVVRLPAKVAWAAIAVRDDAPIASAVILVEVFRETAPSDVAFPRAWLKEICPDPAERLRPSIPTVVPLTVLEKVIF